MTRDYVYLLGHSRVYMVLLFVILSSGSQRCPRSFLFSTLIGDKPGAMGREGGGGPRVRNEEGLYFVLSVSCRGWALL
jgi:hypothetical protein